MSEVGYVYCALVLAKLFPDDGTLALMRVRIFVVLCACFGYWNYSEAQRIFTGFKVLLIFCAR